MDIGYLVHPKIQLPTDNFSIADVGAGTGIWAIDLASYVGESVQLDLLDIDISQCPPREWLPVNVTVEMLDIFRPIPARFVEKYNLIHIRYFACIVRNNDPRPIIQNVLRMLKPGGYIQWSEQDYGSQKIVVCNERIKIEPFTAIMDEFESQSQMTIDAFNWISDLKETLREQGLEYVQVDRYEEGSQLRSFWQQTYMMVLREMSFKLVEGDRMRDLIHTAQNETPKGVFWMRGHLVHIGKKA